MNMKFQIYRTGFRVASNRIQLPLSYASRPKVRKKTLNHICREVSQEHDSITVSELEQLVLEVFHRSSYWMQKGYSIEVGPWGSFSYTASPSVLTKDYEAEEQRNGTQVNGEVLPAADLTLCGDPQEETSLEVIEKMNQGLEAADRYARIEGFLKHHSYISAAECSLINHCSRTTALRDLKALYRKGRLQSAFSGYPKVYTANKQEV